jgi:hypothetical protein
MDKCELSVVGLSKVQWPGKVEVVFYSGRVKAEMVLQ